MQNISTLTKLCFQGNLITDGAADDIAAAISCNIHLQELNLSNNDFTPPGVSKLARSFQKISSLTKLSFYGNCINDNNKIHKMCLRDKSIIDNTINDIATVISNNTDLQELNLSSTGLETLDTIKISRGLQKILSLTKLYINNNNITHEAADDIAAAISCNNHLQELNLGSNNLQTSGTIKIAKALQKISTLIKLYIDRNCITDKAADDIGLALSCNGYLQIVNISENDFSKETAMKISTFASHLTIGINLFIS